jgi:imidazolonepropionase-like amidohydrolase
MSRASTTFTALLAAFILLDVAQAADLALVGATVRPSPEGASIPDATVWIHDGRVRAVGPSASIRVPRGAVVLDGRGLFATAGFWNSHVHILTPPLLHADQAPAEQLSASLEEMLTRWGFTTVFDIASILDNTSTIRRRIEAGEVRGPRILTTGEPFFAPGGTPVYVKPFLAALHIAMPEVTSTAQAVERARGQLRAGADGLKIFAGSFLGAKGVLVMPVEMARAIVAEAHRAHRPVFAHPQNHEGLDVALRSGVDVLAHTAPEDGAPWTEAVIRRMKDARIALVPTLALARFEAEKAGNSPEDTAAWEGAGIAQLRAYAEAGGTVLFGTDVGYTDRFDTSGELRLMAQAGMSFPQILASLTTAPAARFGRGDLGGRIVPGMEGDLTVVSGDPASDVTALARVRYTVRGGRVIYRAP